jgi:hypothetical protein
MYAEMVQGRQILMFYTTMVLIANDCGYKILRFWANPQKYQTLVPAKNSHLKVYMYTHHIMQTIIIIISPSIDVFVVRFCELQLYVVSPVREGGTRHHAQLLPTTKHVTQRKGSTLRRTEKIRKNRIAYDYNSRRCPH